MESPCLQDGRLVGFCLILKNDLKGLGQTPGGSTRFTWGVDTVGLGISWAPMVDL